MQNKTFAVIKDPHFRFGLGKPVGRKDTFEQEILDKIDKLIEACKQAECTDLIVTGDLFDIKAPSLYDFKAIKSIQAVFDRFKENNIKVYSIAGNHDLPAASRSNKPDSVYQYFANQGSFIDLESANHPNITGIDFRNTTEELMGILKSESLKDIVVVHEHLFPSKKDYTGFGHYLYYRDVANAIESNEQSYCTVVIAGHLHKGFATQKVGDILFINPWSFTRLARDHYTVNDLHKPTVTFFTISGDTGTVIDYLDYELEHSSFSESFNTQEVLKQRDLDVSIKEFVSKLNDFSSGIDIDYIISETTLTDEVGALVKHYIDKATVNIK